MPELHPDAIREALTQVDYPGFSKNVVELGLIADVTMTSAQSVRVVVDWGDAEPGLRQSLAGAMRDALTSLGLEDVEIVPKGAEGVVRELPRAGHEPAPAPKARAATPVTAKQIVGVASGKGGVGKSTVAINLAVELARRGRRVGLLDADVHGPSSPLMLGLEGRRPEIDGETGQPIPLEAFGVRVMSMGFFVERDNAVIWRGPIVGNFIKQLLTDVQWGELDDLIIDFPPGTGDAQLTISQVLQLSGSFVVTTPNDLACIDAVKAAAMFQKVQVPLLGLVENMAFFQCPHCDEPTEIFGPSRIKEVASSMGTEVATRIPIDPKVVTESDAGRPVVLELPDSCPAACYRELADRVVALAERREEPSGLSAFFQRFSHR